MDLNAKVATIKSAETHREYLTLAELERLAQTECHSPLLKRMEEYTFTPKTNLDEYLNSMLNTQMFHYLKDKENLSETEILAFFNLFYEQVAYVYTLQNTPLSLIKHLTELEVSASLLPFLLEKLAEYFNELWNYVEESLRTCADFMDKEAQRRKDRKFDFQRVQKHLETLPNITEKINYLVAIRTDYMQLFPVMEEDNYYTFDYGSPYDKRSSFYSPYYEAIEESNFEEQCRLEILKLQNLLDTNKTHTVRLSKGQLQKGEYTNMVRLLIALNEAQIIQNEKGMRPSQIELMQVFGELFDLDLAKKYAKLLNQGISTSSLEANTKIFDQLKTVFSLW